MPDEVKVRVDYSPQAEQIINKFKEFSKTDFEAWFLQNIPVGSSNILEYVLNQRDRIEEEKKKEKEKKKK